jgi:hypothetical protein
MTVIWTLVGIPVLIYKLGSARSTWTWRLLGYELLGRTHESLLLCGWTGNSGQAGGILDPPEWAHIPLCSGCFLGLDLRVYGMLSWRSNLGQQLDAATFGIGPE